MIFKAILPALFLCGLLPVITSCGKADSAGTAGSPPGKAGPKRFHHAKEGRPVYFFRPLYAPNTRHATYEFERLPGGAVRFISARDNREYCLTQPFELSEQPLPQSASDDEPLPDAAKREKEMNEHPKFYLVTAYGSPRGTRYEIFKYAIDRNGTLHFAHNGNKLAISPPYVIEENLLGAGQRPAIPDYPPAPDRG